MEISLRGVCSHYLAGAHGISDAGTCKRLRQRTVGVERRSLLLTMVASTIEATTVGSSPMVAAAAVGTAAVDSQTDGRAVVVRPGAVVTRWRVIVPIVGISGNGYATAQRNHAHQSKRREPFHRAAFLGKPG